MVPHFVFDGPNFLYKVLHFRGISFFLACKLLKLGSSFLPLLNNDICFGTPCLDFTSDSVLDLFKRVDSTPDLDHVGLEKQLLVKEILKAAMDSSLLCQ